MHNDSGRTVSIWSHPRSVDHGPLQHDASCDVCVVGGGIAGLSVAHALATEGKAVILIDDGPLCGGETYRTTAHLSAVPELGYRGVIAHQGKDRAAAVIEAHQWAINRTNELATGFGAECDFQQRDVIRISRHADPERAEQEMEAELEAAESLGVEASLASDTHPGLAHANPHMHIAGMAQFSPMSFCDALAHSAAEHNARLHTHTAMRGLDRQHNKLIVTTHRNFSIVADAVVVATNSPVSDRFAMHTKQAAYRTYVLAFNADEAAHLPDRHIEDTHEPYHYVRFARDRRAQTPSRVLLVGGEDHKTGQADDAEERWERLAAWAADALGVRAAPVARWSGQVMQTIDGAGFVGKDPGSPEDVYLVTGDCGQGTTLAAVAARVIPALVNRIDDPFINAFDPARKPLRAIADFAKLGANVAAQYADLVKPLGSVDPSDLHSGQGTVVRENGKPIAVCRDHTGTVHRCGALCPHMQAVVRWNQAEQTWDCPAHGSRFSPDGRCLNAPSAGDLPCHPARTRGVEVKQHTPNGPTDRDRPDDRAKKATPAS